MEEAYQEGRLRAIGVCNFHAAQLLDFCESVEMQPCQEQNRSSQEHRILIFSFMGIKFFFFSFKGTASYFKKSCL